MSDRKTLRLPLNAEALDQSQSQASLKQAASILQAGGMVAFPTETVYGLGANALDAVAVRGIFGAKARPEWDPLIVHIAALDGLGAVARELPAKAEVLMRSFWPGPLTLLLPKSAALPPIVTAGRERVGVRMPSHPVARRLIELARIPIAAPSANLFGRTSPTRAEFVLEDLDGRIDAVLDAGEATLGLESTVLDICEDPPILYRPGMISLEALEAVVGQIVRYSETTAESQSPQAQPSPGIGLKHYSPRAKLILYQTENSPAALIQELQARGEKVGVMQAEELKGEHAAGNPLPIGTRAELVIYSWGRWADWEELARRLFAGLRELDRAAVTVIVCPLPEAEGVAHAIRDRLLKAAR